MEVCVEGTHLMLWRLIVADLGKNTTDSQTLEAGCVGPRVFASSELQTGWTEAHLF